MYMFVHAMENACDCASMGVKRAVVCNRNGESACFYDPLYDFVLIITFFFGQTLIITLFGILISLDLLHQSF